MSEDNNVNNENIDPVDEHAECHPDSPCRQPVVNLPTDAEGVVHFVTDSDKNHDDCPDGSPCKDGEYEVRTIGGAGVRGVVVNDEVWLSRTDVLALLGRVFYGYESVANEAPADTPQHIFGSISAQTINLFGGQLHRLTQMDNAIDMTVPDTIPADWLNGTTPAPESAIERAIRLAKEAALKARGDNNESKDDEK